MFIQFIGVGNNNNIITENKPIDNKEVKDGRLDKSIRLFH